MPRSSQTRTRPRRTWRRPRAWTPPDARRRTPSPSQLLTSPGPPDALDRRGAPRKTPLTPSLARPEPVAAGNDAAGRQHCTDATTLPTQPDPP